MVDVIGKMFDFLLGEYEPLKSTVDVDILLEHI